MMRKVYWLDDEVCAAIEPQLPKNHPGSARLAQHDLETLQLLVSPAAAEQRIDALVVRERASAVGVDRLQPREGTPLRPWKRMARSR